VTNHIAFVAGKDYKAHISFSKQFDWREGTLCGEHIAIGRGRSYLWIDGWCPTCSGYAKLQSIKLTEDILVTVKYFGVVWQNWKEYRGNADLAL
jgi:hypothetical protein